MTPNDIDRRAFVKATGTAVGGMILVPACAPAGGKWRFLTEAEAIVVDAIAEQIIPADDDAGAHDANVVNFIDLQLIGPYEEHQQAYRTGVAGVQQTSNAMFGGAASAGTRRRTRHRVGERVIAVVLRADPRPHDAGFLRQPAPRRQPAIRELPDDRPRLPAHRWTESVPHVPGQVMTSGQTDWRTGGQTDRQADGPPNRLTAQPPSRSTAQSLNRPGWKGGRAWL